MLTAGDERGRTQHGNNNAYCQDSEISWIDWSPEATDEGLLEFVRRLASFRRRHPVFRRRRFFHGLIVPGRNAKDLVWLNPDGREMSEEQWQHEHARCLGMYLSGHAIDEPDERGQRVTDDDFLLLINAHHEDIAFTLPANEGSRRWGVVFDTAREQEGANRYFKPGEAFPLTARSLALLVQLAEGA